MNPRFRRLLIPGLLVVLLAIVLVRSVIDRADGAPAVESEVVSRIDDPRITESSGLVVSTTHDDLAYTINDSGNAPIVFAIRVSTGVVVGMTRVDATWLDTEALALHDETLWVADTGDNARSRGDAAVFSLPEPGRRDGTVTPTRYPVSYEDGPQDVEAVVVRPDGRVLLLSKGPAGGVVLRLPEALRTDATNIASATDDVTPAFTTDATITNDGSQVLVRNYAVAQVRDTKTWELLRTDPLPDQPQGETIAVEPSDDSYLVGSEGQGSALIRVALDPAAAASAPPTTDEVQPPPSDEDEAGVRVPVYVVMAVGALAVVVAGLVVVRRRSRAS